MLVVSCFVFGKIALSLAKKKTEENPFNFGPEYIEILMIALDFFNFHTFFPSKFKKRLEESGKQKEKENEQRRNLA